MKQLLDCITEAANPNYTLNEKDEKSIIHNFRVFY